MINEERQCKCHCCPCQTVVAYGKYFYVNTYISMSTVKHYTFFHDISYLPYILIKYKHIKNTVSGHLNVRISTIMHL
jgi:hypothetical protein